VVVVVVDTGVNVVVLTGNIIFCPLLFPLFLLLFQGFDGYLGAIVGIIGVGGKVPNSQLFTVVPHLSGLGFGLGLLVGLVGGGLLVGGGGLLVTTWGGGVGLVLLGGTV
jgi:hypothetical protein